MISIKGLNKYFNKGRQNEIHVINDVTIDLPERGMVAIFGKSGCGKTTLLNVIGGLDRYASGKLTVEGQNVGKNTDTVRNKYIGYIFQNYNLHKNRSCFDNVADALRICGMTDKGEIESRVKAALTNVGMEKYGSRTPDTLSGGQQQRIAIARAIVKNPKIILADEPTGNLDEANTVMIMDLLKAISKDHLVLLVTHEADLVDYYCDKIIELSDGKIANVKENKGAGGFFARDKNDIYLGELNKTELSGDLASVDYYGEPVDAPVRIRIVNNGGKIYVKVDSQNVQILDEFSEVKLKEGVFEQKETANSADKNIDMSALPPVEGSRFGRLFTFGSALKSGYVANFQKRKKGKKLLCACMGLFAAVIVFVSSIFGSAFGDLLKANDAYNHNVFYVYTPNGDVSKKLNDAVGKEGTGIDHVNIHAGYGPDGDSQITFFTGNFETFAQDMYESNFNTNAVYLSETLSRELQLVEGRWDGLSDDEILITTKVADALLEKSALGYISEYRDLIGLLTANTYVSRSFRVVGIVESNETAVYLTDKSLARIVYYFKSPSLTDLASDYGVKLSAGETVLTIRTPVSDVSYPKVGETVTVQGRELLVTEIRTLCTDYETWLSKKGVAKLSDMDYFIELVRNEMPGLQIGSDDFNKALAQISEERYFEYRDYFYDEIDEFCRDMYFFDQENIDLWLYVVKGVEAGKFSVIYDEDYFKATKYKALYGRYPTMSELAAVYDELPDIATELKESYISYETEFYNGNHHSSYYNNLYLVSDEDYVAFSKQTGETHPTAVSDSGFFGDIVYTESYDSMVIPSSSLNFTVVHSKDPSLTKEWIKSTFPDLEMPEAYDYYDPITAPINIFYNIIMENIGSILRSLVTMGLMLILMSVCMYFIMRSSMMNRIKEVGIYRAIGVSKKNLVFRFFVEALVLTTLTTFVGFLTVSGIIYAAMGISTLISSVFYYPLWLAVAVLFVLYVISLFFGTVPILSLLRKTPSEILAKYDI